MKRYTYTMLIAIGIALALILSGGSGSIADIDLEGQVRALNIWAYESKKVNHVQEQQILDLAKYHGALTAQVMILSQRVQKLEIAELKREDFSTQTH